MNDDWNFNTRDLTDREAGWLLLGFGTAAVFGAVFAIRSGKISAAYRKWGWWVRVNVERDVAPIQFSIRVAIQLIFGFVLIFFGVGKVLFS